MCQHRAPCCKGAACPLQGLVHASRPAKRRTVRGLEGATEPDVQPEPHVSLGVVRPRPVYMCAVDNFVSSAVQPCRYRAVHCRTSQGGLEIVPPGLEGWAAHIFGWHVVRKYAPMHDGFDSRPPGGVGRAHGSSSGILDAACSHPPTINRPPVSNSQTTVAGNSHFLCAGIGTPGHCDTGAPA